MTRVIYQGFTPFNRRQLSRLKSGLAPGTPYFQRLAACGTLSQGDHGYVLRCRLPPCPGCRSAYATRQGKFGARLFEGASNDHAGMVTLVLGACSGLDEVEGIVAKARKDLRNFVDLRRGRDSRWDAFTFVGYLEVDALAPEDLRVLGGQRAALLGQVGASAAADSAGPIWIPTIHGVARFDSLDWQEVQEELAQQWSIERQAHVAPFLPHLTVRQNVENTTNYALKHRCRTTLGHVREPWPVDWMIDYYGWLAGWSESFKRTRIMVRGKKQRVEVGEITRDDDTREVDAMPHVFTTSVLPTLYNW